MDFALFKKIAELPGVSGREETVRAALLKLLRPLTDEIRVDGMGSVIACKKGRGVRKLLLAAHMDEVGFMVNHVDDNGFLRFIAIGNVDPRTLPAQRVNVYAEKGTFTGVIGSKPAHLLDLGETAKSIPLKGLFIDTGLGAEAKNLIGVGDTAGFDRTAVEMGSRGITSKSIDDRIGVYIILEVLKKIKKHDCDVYVALTAQEEVGARGAVTAAYGIDPDLALVLEATAANDLPATPAYEHVCASGGGVAVTVIDSGTIVNHNIVKFLKKLASDNKIPHQLKISSRGANDAAAIHKTKSGVPAGILSVPTRYIHTSVETVSKTDIDAAVDLTVSFAENCCKQNFDF